MYTMHKKENVALYKLPQKNGTIAMPDRKTEFLADKSSLVAAEQKLGFSKESE